jgi:hypothetical protein
MPRADLFPKYYDHALRCREQNLPNTADFIHKIGKAADVYKEALEFCVNALAEYESDLKRPKSLPTKGDLTPFLLGALDKARFTLQEYGDDVVPD